MTADEVYKIILYASAKNKQQGYVSPADFNNVLMPVAQRSFLDYLLGEYQKYKTGRPIAVVQFGQNERIRQSLSPLIYSAILPINSITGIAPFPSDYEYPDAMWGLYGFYNIRFIQQDRQDAFIHSEIDPITENPVYLIRHEGFQFYPETLGSARMSYVRTAPSIVWAYVLDSNNRPVYDPTNSQQPVWGDTDMMNIICRALAIIGINLQLGIIVQYAQEIKNGGA